MNPTSAGIELHRGLDIAAPLNTPIKAIHTGKVTTGYDPNGFGNYVVIENSEKKYKSIYAHCEALNVSNGQEVTTGDTIAFVGSTGNSTGAHLHLEFFYQNEYMNPYFYLTIDDRKNPTNNLGNHGEAMNDPVFKNLINYAEQYLGFPYVFGGSSPETSFDCSGFICWVYTHSGTYNLPRTTAQGIYNQCAPVSPNEAKPGDLIFFEGTYDAGEPVTHIGIYVGNGQMLHCGDPVQYATINDPYWSSHFYGFGRLK
nr:peptidoglycan DD-metalloendopeptidase family protein [Enterococcus plantarum]